MNEVDQHAESGLPREAALFQAAAQLTGPDRAAFLDRACRGDAALRQRLEALLAAHEQTEGVLAEPAPAAKATMKLELADIPDETVGQKIGRYKILEKVGEGGCGVVYVAEQTEPVRRRVALKVIKLGMDTKQVVARFEAERQALAMMDHPNIAKVLDAGTTETGRPYFIMELVRGIRITDYCDQNNLSTKDRLDLFIQVCHAIQHAHQKGIIHRDIKPSNILVTLNDGVPVPKVIDFGIAKATTDQRLTDKTVYTQLQQFIGTPAYMSPEQAEMSSLDIDTRSDIYSLGVLLYELLTGKTPFDTQELMSKGIDAMRRTIREIEPAKPSTRLATLQGDELTTAAKRRAVEAPRLIHLLKGDLDWIVMKCLEKDRSRRYETANGVAADIKRHLNNEPVVARPPSKLYEFQRTVRRHKFGFAATAAIIIVLAIGVLVSTWQAARARREATRATVALDELRQTAPAFALEARSLAAQERFDEAIAKLDYAIKLRPDTPEYLVAKSNLLQCRALSAVLRMDGFKFDLTLLPDDKYRLTIQDQPFSDLSLLNDAPIEELIIMGTSVSDIRPLEQLALTHLDIRNTRVSDLRPLRSPVLSASLRELDLWEIPATDFSPLIACTNLEYFDAADTALTNLDVVRCCKLHVALLSATRITDISVLAGMPLERVTLDRTALADISPLLHCPALTDLVLPPGARDVKALRALPALEKLSFDEFPGGFSAQAAVDFWLGYEHGGITTASVSILAEQSVKAPQNELLAMKVAALQAWFGLDADYAATCKRMIKAAERADENGYARERAAKNWCLRPANAPAMLSRVLALAREAVKTDLRTDQRPWYLQTLGMAEFRAGHDDAAEAAFLRAEQAADTDNWHPDLRPFIQGPSRFYRAMILFRKGKDDAAKALFQKAESQMPPIPENAAHVLPVGVTQDQLLYWLAYREAKALLQIPDTAAKP